MGKDIFLPSALTNGRYLISSRRISFGRVLKLFISCGSYQEGEKFVQANLFLTRVDTADFVSVDATNDYSGRMPKSGVD